MFNLRVIVSRMVNVVANARGQENPDIFPCQLLRQLAQMNEPVHHLTDAETVSKVVKGVVTVVFLYAKLYTHKNQQKTCSFLEPARPEIEFLFTLAEIARKRSSRINKTVATVQRWTW